MIINDFIYLKKDFFFLFKIHFIAITTFLLTSANIFVNGSNVAQRKFVQKYEE